MGGADCGGELGGEPSIFKFRRRLSDVRGERVGWAVPPSVGDGGVGGKGPLGGGKGDFVFVRVGEAGIGYKVLLLVPLVLPWLELRRCIEALGRRPLSSVREGRPTEVLIGGERENR